MDAQVQLSEGALAHPKREHHLDAVRAFLMLLGIPYHAAHPYRADGETWFVLSSQRSDVLTFVIDFLHLFRMQGFFIIAGYFSALLIAKRRTRVFLRTRLTRLLPPLITSLLLIVPVMNLISFLEAYPSQVALHMWLKQIASLGRSTTGHLWFIIVLVYYTVALAILSYTMPTLRQFSSLICARLTGLAFTILLIISGLAIGLYESGALKVVEHVPAVMKNVGSVGFALEYAPYFMVGAILNRTPNINAMFNKVSAGVMTVGLLAGISAVILQDHIALPIIRCLAAVTAVAITQTIVAASSKFFDEERRFVRRAVDASFVIYLFHLPIIIAALWVVDGLPVHFILQFGLLCAIALGGALAVWSVVKRYPVAQFWLNGIPPPTTRT